MRLGPDRFLATATGSIKGFLTDDDLVVIDGDGRAVSPPMADAPTSPRRASSEIQMHLAIYQERPDVEAVVHAHPPTATGFATAGVTLDACVLPEIVATLGAVPTAPYATPSTRALADAVRSVVREGHACLLANHGAVAYDDDLFRGVLPPGTAGALRVDRAHGASSGRCSEAERGRRCFAPCRDRFGAGAGVCARSVARRFTVSFVERFDDAGALRIRRARPR